MILPFRDPQAVGLAVGHELERLRVCVFFFFSLFFEFFFSLPRLLVHSLCLIDAFDYSEMGASQVPSFPPYGGGAEGVDLFSPEPPPYCGCGE